MYASIRERFSRRKPHTLPRFYVSPSAYCFSISSSYLLKLTIFSGHKNSAYGSLFFSAIGGFFLLSVFTGLVRRSAAGDFVDIPLQVQDRQLF